MELTAIEKNMIRIALAKEQKAELRAAKNFEKQGYADTGLKHREEAEEIRRLILKLY